ncbi:MAG: thiamine pyrophosphate-dependent enzyme, partial [Alphaproteobacteria bacterium]
NFGLDFKNPDFCCYAEAYGATGHCVSSTAEFAPLLAQCLQIGGVHLVDVRVDYSENDRILNHEIKERSRDLVAGSQEVFP